MILVTLGTHPQPMDRLIRAIDDLLERSVLQERVVVQSAAFGFVPRHAEVVAVQPYEWLRAAIEEASVVVSHAGPGTLAAIRMAGRVPVVVPRLREAGEHVDDHQRAYAARLAGLPGYVVVTDLDRLPEAIDRARELRFDAGPPDVSRASVVLERLLRDASL